MHSNDHSNYENPPIAPSTEPRDLPGSICQRACEKSPSSRRASSSANPAASASNHPTRKPPQISRNQVRQYVEKIDPATNKVIDKFANPHAASKAATVDSSGLFTKLLKFGSCNHDGYHWRRVLNNFVTNPHPPDCSFLGPSLTEAKVQDASSSKPKRRDPPKASESTNARNIISMRSIESCTADSTEPSCSDDRTVTSGTSWRPRASRDVKGSAKGDEGFLWLFGSAIDRNQEGQCDHLRVDTKGSQDWQRGAEGPSPKRQKMSATI